MFTGIVTDVGRVASVADRGDRRFVIATRFDTATIALGASVACSGCCLTVVERTAGHFAVDVSSETLSVTTLDEWTQGTEVNLERALRIGDELGGHLVSGHVDGVSLTVNEVDGRRFGVNIIPHTWTQTTFRRLASGSRVNLEIDLLARYVARLRETEQS